MARTKRLRLPRLQITTASLLWLVFTVVSAHILFSWMGFNPAEDGAILAGSRRLQEGAVPHRDFLSLRPVGSSVLHLPALLFGAGYSFWISRLLVWFQIGAVAWSWPGIVHRFLKIHVPTSEYQRHAAIAFALTAHLAPLIPAPSLDGLFLLSIGLVACLKSARFTRMVGYALIGMAGLCEPSYLLMVPFSLGIIGGWARARYWMAAVFPWLLYLAWLLLASAVPDAYRQIALTPLGIGGVSPGGLLLGAVVGAAAAYFSYSKLETGTFSGGINAARWAGTLALFSLPVLAALFLISGRYEGFASWMLLGGALGGTAAVAFHERKFTWRVRIGALAAGAALAACLASGHGGPALASGPLAVLLLGFGRIYPRNLDTAKEARSAFGPLASVAAVAVLACFAFGRYQHVPGDRSVGQINESLEGIVPGAGFIQTNRRTYEFMVDLRDASERATTGRDRTDHYTLLPGLPGHWVSSVYQNPLPFDTAGVNGVTNPALIDTAADRLDGYKGHMIVLIQKVDAAAIATEDRPLPPGPYDPLIAHVRKTYKKFGETRYFELYR